MPGTSNVYEQVPLMNLSAGTQRLCLCFEQNKSKYDKEYFFSYPEFLNRECKQLGKDKVKNYTYGCSEKMFLLPSIHFIQID